VTPQERADLLFDIAEEHRLCNPNHCHCWDKLRGQIEEAQREARDMECERVHKLWASHDKEVSEAVAEGVFNSRDAIFAEGFRAAREKATGIAEECDNCTKTTCEECETTCCEAIAQRIGSMEL